MKPGNAGSLVAFAVPMVFGWLKKPEAMTGSGGNAEARRVEVALQ